MAYLVMFLTNLRDTARHQKQLCRSRVRRIKSQRVEHGQVLAVDVDINAVDAPG